jgi:oxygen-independent coproporphyrinogen-3 oxidase
MSGIYIHIPFCKKRCHYCDFYKSVDLLQVDSFLAALSQEIFLRKDYLNERIISTIYFGGGTPSILSAKQLCEILNLIRTTYTVLPEAEITMEANPDDLSAEYLKEIKSIGINRLSIGIQSFSDKDLIFMGRRHSAMQAIEAVKMSQSVGFENISIDLIYGIPGMSLQQWKENLQQAFQLKVQHLSAYHLTFHKGTQFWKQLAKGVIREIEEDESIMQFEMLIEEAQKNDFVHYEISNFALDGFFSKHNTSYWNQTEYLGLGPSAHSYNKTTRFWNISSVKKYLQHIDNKTIAGEFETLSINDKFNDYLLTRLRTCWGISKNQLLQQFGSKYFQYFEQKIIHYKSLGFIEESNDNVYITKKGLFISDSIIEELFYV